MEIKEIILAGEVPDFTKVDRAHAVLLTRDGRVLMRVKNGEVRLTGGRVDDGDRNYAEVLRREVSEEINCKIDKCAYLGCMRMMVDKKEELWLRAVARVSEIGEPRPDPDRDNDWVYGRMLAPRCVAMEAMNEASMFATTNEQWLNMAYDIAEREKYFDGPLSDEIEVLNLETHS